MLTILKPFLLVGALVCLLSGYNGLSTDPGVIGDGGVSPWFAIAAGLALLAIVVFPHNNDPRF